MAPLDGRRRDRDLRRASTRQEPEPLADPSLLAGRETQLADAQARWGRWRQEDGIPLVIQGRPGSGITSFIRVLIASVEEIGGTAR